MSPAAIAALLLLLAALPPVAVELGFRQYTRTLETARHRWWMRLLGRRRTARVIALLLYATGLLPARLLAARLARDARDKARALRTGHGLYLDSGEPVGKGAVLLCGSSTFTYWKRFAEDLAPLPVVNAAFGGSTTGLVNRHFEPLVQAHAPRVICYFAGTNDITYGLPPERAVAGFLKFVQRVQAQLPQTVAIVYLGINTTPFTRGVGASRVAAVRFVNAEVRRYVEAHDGSPKLSYVDLDAEPFTDDLDYYLWDGHHLNEAGHAKLGALLRPVLTRHFEGG